VWGKESRVPDKHSEVRDEPSDEDVLVRVCAGDRDALALLHAFAKTPKGEIKINA
jgi:hypothetical protein